MAGIRRQTFGGSRREVEQEMYLELINAPVDLQPSYTLTNARLGYTDPSGRWDVFAYCKNCFNTLYRIYNLDLSGFSASISRLWPAAPLWRERGVPLGQVTAHDRRSRRSPERTATSRRDRFTGSRWRPWA